MYLGRQQDGKKNMLRDVGLRSVLKQDMKEHLLRNVTFTKIEVVLT